MRRFTVKKRKREGETWALKEELRVVHEKLATYEEQRHEESTAAIVEEVNGIMAGYGDHQWVVKKQLLLDNLWSGDYTGPTQDLQDQFPKLATLLLDVMTGGAEGYRQKQLLRAGNEQKLESYDFDKRLQVEGLLASLLRGRNQKSPCFVSEAMSILTHSHNVPSSVEGPMSKFAKGMMVAEKHTQETLNLMMSMRPTPTINAEGPKVLSVQLDNNHIRCRRGLERLDENGERVESEEIDTITWMVFVVDVQKHPSIYDNDFTANLYDKDFTLVEQLLDPDNFELRTWRRRVWQRFTMRVIDAEAFMRVDNKPTEVADIRVQKCVVGISGSSYQDNIDMFCAVKEAFPGMDMYEWGADSLPSARMRVLKLIRPEQYAKVTTSRDDDFHVLGHGCFARHIQYYVPVAHPCAKVLNRTAIEAHPVNFEARKYDEHVYLMLLIGYVCVLWLKSIRPDGEQDFLLDVDDVLAAFESSPGPLVLVMFTLEAALPLAAAKESVWNNRPEDVEMFYTNSYHAMRATGKTNESVLMVHHKIDHYCVQDAYKTYLDETRSAAWTKNKHIERGRINEFVNCAGKDFMRGKQIKASTLQTFYETYDASSHVKRVLLAHVNRMNEERTDVDYLRRYDEDKVTLLAFFYQRLGATWKEACRPRPVNGMNMRRSGNEPWKHERAVAEGRRHVGEVNNRMTWLEHVRKHTAKHPRI
jgi:hypothetical protein